MNESAIEPEHLNLINLELIRPSQKSLSIRIQVPVPLRHSVDSAKVTDAVDAFASQGAVLADAETSTEDCHELWVMGH